MKKNNIKLRQDIEKISKMFDSTSLSVEANVLYEDKEGVILTNLKEEYHFYIKLENNIFIICNIKNNLISEYSNTKYIPDFNNEMNSKSLGVAISRLYAEIEKIKIRYFLNKIKEKIKQKRISEKEYFDLIILEAKYYGIDVKKDGKNLVFENNDSIMEIKKETIEEKRMYSVYLNNIFLFSFEYFIETIEKAFLRFVLNKYKNKGTSQQRKGVGLRFKLTPEKKE